MTWVKLDDQYPTHPKVMQAGQAAAWLHVCGLCYCARYLTDGAIPKVALPALGAANPVKSAKRLVEVGLWVDVGDQYLVHDYHDYQPSSGEVLKKKSSKSSAGSKGNHVRHHVKTGEPSQECRYCLAEGLAPAIANGSQTPRETVARPRPRPRPPTSLSSSGLGEGNPQPVDDEDARIGQVLGIIADRRCAEHGKAGNRRYRARVIENLRSEEALDTSAALLLQDFPDAPADLLAASLLGDDARNLAHYRRAS